MTDFKEYWITGFCPYCDKALSLFKDNMDFTIMYQCPECTRGLTIISMPMMKIMIEPGMPKQKSGDIFPMPTNLWGLNA